MIIDFSSLGTDAKLKFIEMLSEDTGISKSKLLSIYIIYGDDLFYLLMQLESIAVTFPSKDRLYEMMESVMGREL